MARSVSPRRSIRSGCGSPVKRSQIVCDGGLVHIHHRGVVVATHARRHQPDKERVSLRRATRAREATPAAADGVGGVGDPQGRLVRQRVLRRHELPGRQQPIGVDRSKSPSSVTTSRSRSAKSSSGGTRSATTAPANTARSPTPAADHAASTPPKTRGPSCQVTTGPTLSSEYRTLTRVYYNSRRLVVARQHVRVHLQTSHRCQRDRGVATTP